MSRERIEPETLAAFIEGKLEPAERERVLRILAENPEEYEVFADAAAAAGQLGDRSVVPISARRRSGGGWKVAVPLLAAAGLAAVVLLRPDSDPTPGELARRLTVVSAPGPGSLATRLGETWAEPGWSVMRGGTVELIEPARAFRLGARATDVELAFQARDTAALAEVGAELIDLVGGVDAGAAAAAQYRAIVSAGTSASESARKDAAGSLRALMGGSVWFDVGAWVEAARVAAMAGHLGGLRSISASLRGIADRVGREPSELTGPVLLRLRALELLSPIEENRQAILDMLTQIMVQAGR